MNKLEKDAFLLSGGKLLRASVDKNGQHSIKQKTLQQDWHVRLNVSNSTIANSIISNLTINHPTKFQKD